MLTGSSSLAPRRAALAGIALLCLLAGTILPAGAAPLTPEEKQAFAWFDALGFASLQGRKLVRVGMGGGSPQSGNWFRLAFLLSEEGDRFTVLTPDLRTLVLTKSAAGTPDYQRVFYEPVDLAKEVTAYLAFLRSPAERQDHWRRFGEGMAERAELFVLARTCAAEGLNDLAHGLYTHAAAMPNRQGQPPAKPFTRCVAQDLAHAMIWRAVVDFGQPKVSRAELLQRFSDIARRFPESEYAGRARATATLLQQMVREDEERAAKATPRLEEMAVPARVAELIYQLRDQNGQQYFWPGRCDIFMDPRRDESPAQQLVRIGYPAVPALITAIEDRRFTRCVGCGRDFFFSHSVLRVGDCAMEILSRIAGRRFDDRSYSYQSLFDRAQEGVVRKSAEAWWQGYQRKGECQALVDGTAAGDENATTQARMLLGKYPDTALAAISAGVRKAGRTWVRADLLEVASRLAGDAPVSLLLSELKSEANLHVRLAAARGLHRRGRPEGVTAMVDAWKRLTILPEALRDHMGSFYDEHAPEELVEFLASCSRTAAIRALAEGLRRRPVDIRLAVVCSFAGGGVDTIGMGSGMGVGGTGSSLKKVKPEPGVQGAVEDLLVSCLDDTEVRAGLSGTIAGPECCDPRICDMAARLLARANPEKYAFDARAWRPARDRRLVEMQNIWRKEHGQPVLPLPEIPHAARVAGARAQPLLDRLLQTGAGGEREQAAAGILALGIGALPAVAERAGREEAQAAERAGLSALQRRLASIVVDVALASGSAPPNAAVREALDDLQGKPLAAGGLTRVALRFAEAPPAGVSGISIAADRSADGSGVSVVARLHPGEKTARPAGGWSTAECVTVGQNALWHSYGRAARGNVGGHYNDLRAAIEKALASPSDTPFEIRFSLMLGR